MTGLLEIADQDIESLDQTQLTRLLKTLLVQEARRAGIPLNSAEVSLNITVADGGEDGRISWLGNPQSTEFLPSRFVQFQVKATELSPAQCASELVDENGEVKSLVDQALHAGATYVLFINQELNVKAKQKRTDAMRKTLREKSKSYADTVDIRIYDASRIQIWTNQYLSAVAAVAVWVRRPVLPGLQSWREWGERAEYSEFPFIADDKRRTAVSELRAQLANPRATARIIGLSGLGKTRLAYEVFKPKSEADQLFQSIAYVDVADGVSDIPARVSDWIRMGMEGIIVLDNCDLACHKSVASHIRRLDSKFSLLSLDYNFDRDSEPTVILEPMEEKYIKEMLDPLYKEQISDLDRVVRFAQGFPQMAVLLAKARLSGSEMMGSLTDDDLMKKMLWGRSVQDNEALAVLRSCAVFDRFGVEDEAKEEAKYIASEIAGVTDAAFHRAYVRFRSSGVIDTRGRYAQIVPKPLAIRLAADWWRETPSTRAIEIIRQDKPGALDDGLCERIAKLDFLPKIKELTKELCGESGPFGQAEVILSSRGSYLFRALAEVNPKDVADALSRVLLDQKVEAGDIRGDTRRNLVWTLEKLVFRSTTFRTAARCLLKLAIAENESWGNNATGQFVQLFNLYLSGTEVPALERIPLVDEALAISDDRATAIAVKALEAALKVGHFTRTGGAEQQGTQAPLRDWRPSVYKEMFEYWDAALDRLARVATSAGNSRLQAKAAIAHSIRGLMQYGRVQSLDRTIRRIVETDGPLWPEAVDNLRTSINYDSAEMPEEGRKALNDWIALLEPSKLDEKLKLFVSLPPFDHIKDGDGHFIDASADRARELAQELVNNHEEAQLAQCIDVVLIGEQRQAYVFGLALATASSQSSMLALAGLERAEKIANPNLVFISALLQGIKEKDPKGWADLLLGIQKRNALFRYYADLIRFTKPTLNELLVGLQYPISESLPVQDYRLLSYGRGLDHLSSVEVSQLCGRLADHSDIGAWVALEILSMYCLGNASRWNECKDEARELLIHLNFAATDKRAQLDLHHWEEAAKKLFEVNDPDLASHLSAQILQTIKRDTPFRNIEHSIKPVLSILFKNYAAEVWPLFANAIVNSSPVEELQLRSSLSEFLGPSKGRVLLDLPWDMLISWCEANPDRAPAFLASTIPIVEGGELDAALTPQARDLIDRFGANEKVLRAIGSNMGTYSWTGSLVPMYKRQERALGILRDHKLDTVRKWADRYLAYLRQRIDQETTSDAEHDLGIY